MKYVSRTSAFKTSYIARFRARNATISSRQNLPSRRIPRIIYYYLPSWGWRCSDMIGMICTTNISLQCQPQLLEFPPRLEIKNIKTTLPTQRGGFCIVPWLPYGTVGDRHGCAKSKNRWSTRLIVGDGHVEWEQHVLHSKLCNWM